MADIKQVAQWLNDGKFVKLPSMETAFLFARGHRIRLFDGKRYQDYELCLADLLSGDWELAKGGSRG